MSGAKMRSSLINSVFGLALFPHLAISQSSSSPTSSPAPSSSPAAASSATGSQPPRPSSTLAIAAISIPIQGLSDNTFLPWGANVSQSVPLSTENADVMGPVYLNNFIISNAPAYAESSTLPFYLLNAATKGPKGEDHWVAVKAGTNTNGKGGDRGQITLGRNSMANVTIMGGTDGNNQPTDAVVPTVPFGLNQGSREGWMGGVVIAGSYDANRVAGDRWFLLSNSSTNAGNGTSFLDAGKINVTAEVKGRSVSRKVTALIDSNAEAITLPKGFNCSDDLGILINSFGDASPPADSKAIWQLTIPRNLTQSLLRCSVSTTQSDTAILGRPFFQAAYTFVDSDGGVYVTAAHQLKVPILPQKFDAKAQLKPIAPPPSVQDEVHVLKSGAGRLDRERYLILGLVVTSIGVAFGALNLFV